MAIRKIKNLYKRSETMEGAGVKLNRVFGYSEAPELDPFLLLDDFSSDNPKDYARGFPWHPHRGIETITYILEGFVDHGDSLGNTGVISRGDVQWMTAGSGIIHQEMPRGDAAGRISGFQLWANLPSYHKMMDPRYRDIRNSDIPILKLDNGTIIKIICGKINGTTGPVKDIITDPEYLDVSVPPNTEFTHSVIRGYTVFSYLFEGHAAFSIPDKNLLNCGTLILFGDGDSISVITGNSPARFLLVSGKPLHEPVAWQGPIVMNTEEELRTAFSELEKNTFIKTSSI